VIPERWRLTDGRARTIGKEEGEGESHTVWLGKKIGGDGRRGDSHPFLSGVGWRAGGARLSDDKRKEERR
jgi:hypothetical protein